MNINFKRLVSFSLCLIILISCTLFSASADSSKVVTMGADLSESQKELMWEYFGVSKDEVVYIEVNNQQERKYLEGVATEQQIGTRTLSCAYVEPTEEGGIQVKTANLTWVTSSMIASTLATCGIEHCNVIAACPIAVSGTGALTGIIIAYESATGEQLDETKKEVAVEELIETGELADDIGQDEATLLISDIKQEIIEAKGNISLEEIGQIIEEKAGEHSITLTDEQIENLKALMEKISKIDYDYNAIKDTLNNIQDGIKGVSEKVEEGKNFFQKIWGAITGFFGGVKEESKEISDALANTKDYLLGEDAVIDATDDTYVEDNADNEQQEEKQSLWDKIVNWFKNLFGIGEKEQVEQEEHINDITDVASETGEDFIAQTKAL